MWGRGGRGRESVCVCDGGGEKDWPAPMVVLVRFVIEDKMPPVISSSSRLLPAPIINGTSSSSAASEGRRRERERGDEWVEEKEVHGARWRQGWQDEA
jgi:hypothetical protein